MLISSRKFRSRLILVLFIVALIFSANQVEGRGKKKRSNSANSASCASRGLDCTSTCCLDTTCAVDLADCAGYINRELEEIYIGFGTVIALMIGIPCILWSINACMMYKFCQKEDEADGVKTGGFSIFEIFLLVCCCGCCKRKKRYVDDEDYDEEEASQQQQSNDDILKAEHTSKSGNLGQNVDSKGNHNSTQQNSQQDNLRLQGQKKNVPKNPCLKCLCIVFCCMDSNFNEDSSQGNDEKNLLLDDQIAGEPSIEFNNSDRKNSKSKNIDQDDLNLDDEQLDNEEDDNYKSEQEK